MYKLFPFSKISLSKVQRKSFKIPIDKSIESFTKLLKYNDNISPYFSTLKIDKDGAVFLFSVFQHLRINPRFR